MFIRNGYVMVDLDWATIPIMLGGLIVFGLVLLIPVLLIQVVIIWVSKKEDKKERASELFIHFWDGVSRIISFGINKTSEEPPQRAADIILSFCFWLTLLLIIGENL